MQSKHTFMIDPTYSEFLKFTKWMGCISDTIKKKTAYRETKYLFKSAISKKQALCSIFGGKE